MPKQTKSKDIKSTKSKSVKQTTVKQPTIKQPSVCKLKGVSFYHVLFSHHKQIYSKNFKPIDFTNTNDPDQLPMTIISYDSKKEENDTYKTKFIDECKDMVTYLPVMVSSNEYSTKNIDGVLPIYTNSCCWWDKHPIDGTPIGCPLFYRCSTTDKNITKTVKIAFKKMNIKSTTYDFYEVEGVFCSFECAKSYLNEQKNIVKYKNTSILLLHMKQKITGKFCPMITPAPSWKLLDVFGGPLTIEEFRKSFDKLRYTETINIKRPYMYHISTYFSEKKLGA